MHLQMIFASQNRTQQDIYIYYVALLRFINHTFRLHAEVNYRWAFYSVKSFHYTFHKDTQTFYFIFTLYTHQQFKIGIELINVQVTIYLKPKTHSSRTYWRARFTDGSQETRKIKTRIRGRQA